MCGRYKISTKAPQILAAFDAVTDGYEPKERYNVAPTDEVPCIRVDGTDGKRKLVPLRWGLIPFWAKDASIGARMINARVETLFEKSAFKEALEKRRCLVVSDGFYEWVGQGKAKQPHLVCFEDRHVFAYAGLWARWKGPAGPVETCTIITTPPNAVAAKVHDRMPLILDPKSDAARIAAWLDPSRTVVDIEDLRHPRDIPGLTVFPVDKRVGNVKNDDASLAEPVTAPPA
jgi:putative SOS response-associated peptidase YedK